MATEPLFFLGLVLLALGVATISLRGIRGLARRFFLTGGLAFLASGCLLLLIARDKHQFRVTEVRFSAGPQYTGGCPAEKRMLVSVKTTGGAGEVAVRVWADQNYDTPVKKVRVRPEQSVQIYADVEVTRSGIVTAYASVEAPNDGLASAVFRVECTPPPTRRSRRAPTAGQVRSSDSVASASVAGTSAGPAGAPSGDVLRQAVHVMPPPTGCTAVLATCPS